MGEHDRDHLQPIQQQKRALRLELRAQRQRFATTADRATVAAAGRAVAAQVARWVLWPRSGFIALFAPLPGELDPGAIADEARRAGSTLCYPRIVNPDDRVGPPLLSFHVVDDLATLVPSAFGIREPAATAPLAPELDIFITPGFGFDAHGNRLGGGRGYYDAALHRYPAALRVGIGHDWQLLPAIPVEPHDETLDLVVTPSGCRVTQARATHRYCRSIPAVSSGAPGVFTKAEPPAAATPVQKEEST